jgi:DNA replication and repair protein RecF
MHLARLELTNVRSFRRLDLRLGPGAHVIVGDNAQGKTNLLEAVALLATGRTSRAGTDGDLIAWGSLHDDPLPAARLVGALSRHDGDASVEITVMSTQPVPEAPAGAPVAVPRTSRRFRVNGVARRASDLIGVLRVVMFAAQDLRLIDGPPAGRRHYLDITVSQLDREYVRAAQRYARVLQQRNSLLRRIQERRGQLDELDFWDDELAVSGALLLGARASTLREMGETAAERYAELAPGETFEVCYRPAVPEAVEGALFEHDLEARFRQALEEGRRDDLHRAQTRIGPHRDDIEFRIGGRPASTAASRGQQRTAALALRIAEVAHSTHRTGEPPVLLLDDILSELDQHRRERVLAVAHGADQVLITTPDPDRPSAAELPEAHRYRIVDSELAPIEG